MKRKVLAVAFVLAPLLSVMAGTMFVSLVKANPLWFLGYVRPDEYTKAPVVSIFSPENYTVFNTDNVVLSFKVDVGESETAINTWVHHVWCDTDWQHDNLDSFLPPSNSSSYSNNVTLTGIPEGNHSITVHTFEDGTYENGNFSISNSETTFFTIDADPQNGESSPESLLAEDYGIIPEFPSWIILPLLITATLVIIIYKKRLHKRSNQQSY